MTTEQRPSYFAIKEVSPAPTTGELQRFFGVPPSSLQELVDNIKKKRRYWYKLTQAPGAQGRESSKIVSKLIQDISKILLDGAPGVPEAATPGPGRQAVSEELNIQLNQLWNLISRLLGGGQPDRAWEELWDLISRLLGGGEPDRALRVATEARVKWPEFSIPHVAFAFVVSETQHGRSVIDQTLISQGLEAAEKAVQIEPSAVEAWATLVDLNNVGYRYDEAVAAANESEAALGSLAPHIRAKRALALMHLNLADEAVKDCVVAVSQEPDNAGLRADLAEEMVGSLIESLLPLTSRGAQGQYVELVQVASWCAHGVPEAELMVRPHQMWASQSKQRIFSGSLQARSFVAIMTGFLGLPLLHLCNSTQAWKLYLEGPNGKHHDHWQNLRAVKYVQTAHRNVGHRINWT